MPNDNQQQTQPQRRRRATLRQMPNATSSSGNASPSNKSVDASRSDKNISNAVTDADKAQTQSTHAASQVADDSGRQNQKGRSSDKKQADIDAQTETQQNVTSDDETEYEYVSFGELISPFIDKLRFWVNELNVFFVCLLVLLICVVIVIIGNMTSVVFIIGALAILAVLFAIILYSFWQNRKKAYEDLRRAEILYAESQKIISEHVGDDSKNDNKKNKKNSK